MAVELLLWNVVALIAFTVGMGERAEIQTLTEKSQAIEVGWSKQQVKELLGPATLDLPRRQGLSAILFGKRPPQWLYGTEFDVDSTFTSVLPVPNPLPIKLRIFSSYDDDLLVVWNSEGTVGRVRRPTIEVTDASRAVHSVWGFLRSLEQVFPPLPKQ